MPKFAKLLCALSVIGLVSCSYNPFNRNNHLTGDAVGTAAGGLAGFSIASAAGASDAVIGLSTFGGASIGYYMTTLRFAAAGVYEAGGQVFTLGDYVTIEIPAARVFDSNSTYLLPEGKDALRSAAKVLARFNCQNVLVSGNSSGFGTSKLEKKMTTERAKVASQFLWSNGVSSFLHTTNQPRNLTYVGYGNYFPVANDITNEGLRANSRIQITAYPSKDQLLINEKKQAFSNMGDNETNSYLDNQYLDSSYADNAFPMENTLPPDGCGSDTGCEPNFVG